MKRKGLLFFLLLAACMMSCTKLKYRMGDQLLGEWNIDEYKVSQIRSDGSEIVSLNKEDGGTCRFYAGSYKEKHKLKFDLDFEADSFQVKIHEQTVYISEEGKRLVFPNFYCSDDVGCDMAYTIQEFSSSRIVIEVFSIEGTPPPNNLTVPENHPDSEASVEKLRMVLSKQ